MNEHIQHIADIAEQYWERVTRGEPQEDIVRSLREDGYSLQCLMKNHASRDSAAITSASVMIGAA
jgi:hypothetical protein